MANYNTSANIVLTVNGKQAEKMLSSLEKDAKRLETQLAKAASAGDKASMKKLQRELNATKRTMEQLKGSAFDVDKVLRRLDKATPKELNRALKQLQQQLNGIERGSEAWKRQTEHIKRVRAELDKVNRELREGESFWERFNRKMNDWQTTLAAGAAAVTGLVMAGRSAVNAYAEMDAEMANVRKYTGMTAEQVRALNEELMKIDTRTSREELNKLAQEAGRLGKTSQTDVLGFVRAADQINVALDELGDGATLTLSKLTNIFGDEERLGTERSLLAVGSVINELSQNCTASASYLAQFSQRLAGVGAQADMTIPQIMAFAATLDANGQAVEMSATALSQLIMSLFKETEKIATATGMDLEKFKVALQSSTNEGLLMLLDRLHELGGIDTLAPVLSAMGENGARASAVISALAANVDMVRWEQEEANKAFEEATSVTKEFTVQNTTVQAGLDKAKNRLHELAVELGEKLAPVMRHVISSTSLMLRFLSSLVDFIVKYKGTIVTLTVAIVAYNVAVNLAVIKTKLLATWQGVCKVATVALRVATLASSAAVALFTGNITRATAAFKLLSVAIKMNPLGLLVSLLAAVAYGISRLIPKADEFEGKIKKAVSLTSAYNKDLEKERLELDKLFGALEGAKKGSDAYNNAKNKLIETYGTYMQGLINERGEITNLEDAYRRLADAIRIANQERGIQMAKENVETVFAEQMESLTSGLTTSLELYGASTREATRLTQSVVTSLAMGVSIPQSTIDEINAYSKNSPKAGADANWLAKIAPGSQNSFWADLGVVDAVPQPAAIVNKMFDANAIREEGLNEIDITARLNRPLRDLEDHWLNYMIEYANSAVESGGGTVLKVVDALAGTFEQVDVDYNEAKSLLQELQTEQAYRTGSAPKAGSGSGTNGDGDNNTPTPTPTLDSTDKFAAEKEWREQQEALNRIAYATGERDYIAYTQRMDEIAVQFYKKQLAHTDLTATERLSINAQYQEALVKQQETIDAQTIEEENTAHSERIAELRQFYIDGQISKETYDKRIEEEELYHQYNLIALTKEGSRERLQAEERFVNLQIQQMQRRQQETQKLEQKYASMKSEFFGDNPQEKQAKHDADFALLQVVYQRELLAAGNNADEKLRIEEAFEKAKLALKKKYGLLAEEDTRNAMERGIADSLEWLESDGGKALTGTLETLTSGMAAIFSQLSTMMQAELEIQTVAINKRYDAEIARAEGNTYQIKKLEAQKEKEIAKAKNEANRKMFAMQVIQAVAQTATNALSAYGSAAAIPLVGYILAPIAAAMAVAAGAIQIAAIKKQQQASEAQGYAQGGFTPKGRKDEAVGVVHAGEWVASQALVNNPRTRPLLEALDYAQKTNTIGSIRMSDVSRTISAPALMAHSASAPTIVNNTYQSSSDSSERVVAVLNKLDSRLNEPFVTVNTVTGDHGILQAEQEYNRLIKNKSPKSKK